MSKLFKLKKWLTIEETAKHLSGVFSEPVNDSDVLRLGLDRHLTLSVNFVNTAKAKVGRIVSISKARKIEGVPIKSPLGHHRFHGFMLNDKQVLEFDDISVSIQGVFDLPLLGGDRLDVEQVYQMSTNGPEVTLQEPEGTFVLDSQGRYHQIQNYMMDFDSPVDYLPRPGIKLKRLIPHEETRQWSGRKSREIWQEIVIAHSHNDYHYPAASLPRDSVLVVRTDALIEFIQSVNDAQKYVEKPLGTIERKTLLTIIAALAKPAKFDYKDPGKAALSIQGYTDELGAHVSKRAIEEHLKRIPDALETRLK